MLEAHDLTKKYGETTVLDLSELTIPQGQSFGLVGNNGAGKTTFFNLLLDLIQATSGKVTNAGITVHESEVWKKHTAAFIDDSFLIGYLTPEEFFYFVGALRGLNKADVDARLSEYHEFFNGEVLGQKKYLRDLSKGNQKKAGIISTLIGAPRVVVLDEPFANLDPTTQFRLKAIIKKVAANKEVTLLISSHDLAHVTEVCERIVVLQKGIVVKDIGTTTETLRELEAFFSV